MRVLLDINVLLDYFLERQPFVEDAEALFKLLVTNKFGAFVSATTPPHIYYFARKHKNGEWARQILRSLFQTVQVTVLDKTTLENALDLPLKDYEDAVQVSQALIIDLDAIVTRDTQDFKDAPIQVYNPRAFLDLFKESE
jgi:predicted nucleic acid-binding protein